MLPRINGPPSLIVCVGVTVSARVRLAHSPLLAAMPKSKRRAPGDLLKAAARAGYDLRPPPLLVPLTEGRSYYFHQGLRTPMLMRSG